MKEEEGGSQVSVQLGVCEYVVRVMTVGSSPVPVRSDGQVEHSLSGGIETRL